MKKVCLIGFWFGQYAFGVAAIFALYKNIPFLPFVFIAASFFTPILAGKTLGIGKELSDQANETVPSFIQALWKIICIFVITLLLLDFWHISEIGQFHIPLKGLHAVIIFYVAAAFRDFFLIKFYLRQNF